MSAPRPTFGALSYAASYGARALRREYEGEAADSLMWIYDNLRALLAAYDAAASSSSTPLSETPKDAQRQVDAWNSSVPIGTSVDVIRDDGTVLRTCTRSVAWVICDHASVLVYGISGGYLLDRVSVAPLSEPTSEGT